MYVYGNGKWHMIARVEEQGNLKIYIASCGHHYPGESNTSDDQAVLDSKYFCSKCLVLLYPKETKDLKNLDTVGQASAPGPLARARIGP